jgi:hypothetical protein
MQQVHHSGQGTHDDSDSDSSNKGDRSEGEQQR